jgi:hypothetical protein
VLAKAAVEIAKLENEIQIMAPELAETKKVLAETMVEQAIVSKDSAEAQA